VAGSGSSAGYFSTCPPASISVTLANGSTAGTITQGVTQNLTTTITDTQGKSITGLSLTYQSTDPIDITASSGGAITTAFPGVASVYAICQPPSCNPSPINEIGVYGTGLPVSSNPVTVTTPGTASDYVWFAAPGQSQYVVSVELLTGAVGSTVRLPYVPNSMVMDQLGNSLYFGSSHELMVLSTANNTLTTQSTNLPGVVLAISPNNQTLLVNDQVRQLLYIYNVSGSSATTFGGMGTAAAWTPDSDTLYIVDSAAQNLTPANIAAGTTGHTDTLYVYNANTGWTTYPLACSVAGPNCPSPSTGAQSVAITIPSVGAFLSGSSTVAHTWCPSGTVGNYANMSFYPQGPTPDNTVAAQTDVLAATTDGQHILGASTFGTPDTGSNITLSDIGVTIPTAQSPAGILTPISCPLATNSSTGVETLSPLVLTTSFGQPVPITADAAAVNQVVASPESNLAFITYTPPTTKATAGVSLPFYVPATGSTPYTVGSVTFKGSLAASITAPLAGAFTPDNKLFFVSTAGDNMIHYISVPLVTTNPANADTQQISPSLPACTSIANGGTDLGCAYSGPSPATAIVPATAIGVKPRSTT
jgi:sugar lactone lactonase YvrE